MRSKLSLRAAAILLLMLASGPLAHAADDLSPARQATLLLRLLPYDRNLRQRAGETITVAVVYREGIPVSETYGLDMTAALQDLARNAQLRGMPVRVVSIGYSNAEGFEAAVTRNKVTALYVCPGLGDVLDSLTGVTRRQKILSFSGQEGDVRDGLSIGLVRRPAKAGLVVNLRGALAEGANLEPELLALSEVLR